MKHAGDRAIERAEEMVALETATMIAGIRRELGKPGAAICGGCGDEISKARRAAMPSATRCAECQESREIAARRRS